MEITVILKSGKELIFTGLCYTNETELVIETEYERTWCDDELPVVETTVIALFMKDGLAGYHIKPVVEEKIY